MKKLTRLLALVLAAVMMLSCGAFAANGDQETKKELLIQWIFEDEKGNFILDENTPPHKPQIEVVPYEQPRMAFFSIDYEGQKPTPVPVSELKAEGLTLYSLCPGERGKEHYGAFYTTEWNKEYTISYKNEYTITVESKLPSIGMYSKPEATIENYLDPWGSMYYSPVEEHRTAYIIATDTDATAGRHLEKISISKECEDADKFELEKVSDNVYKVTCTGSIEAPDYHLIADITWRQVKFMGGGTIVERFDCNACENASLLYSEKEVPEYDRDNPALYNDVKADFSNKLTLKAGESKDFYTAFTYFDGEQNAWIMRNITPLAILVSDSKLKVTDYVTDDEHFSLDFFKMTLSCDEPGTYTLRANTARPIIDAMYHANGKQYTRAELDKWYEKNELAVVDGALVVYREQTNWQKEEPFEEVYPGEKVIYHMNEEEWCTITVTVESGKPLYTDVALDAWYAPAVSFAKSEGYMKGYGDGKFQPESNITGAEFAQILYNKDGKPAPAEGASFKGVTDQWYAKPILWAAGKGIVTDTGETAIDPEKALTRQQLALMLYNYLGKPEGTADLSRFSDADKVSSWAKPALEWAVSAKVFKGNTDGTLNPAGTTTRAEVAQVLMNYFG